MKYIETKSCFPAMIELELEDFERITNLKLDNDERFYYTNEILKPWLDENIGRVYHEWYSGGGPMQGDVKLWFKSKDDAMRFRLVWG